MCEVVMNILYWAFGWITFKKFILSILIFIVSLPLLILLVFLVGALYVLLAPGETKESKERDPYEEYKASKRDWINLPVPGGGFAIFLMLFFASAGTLYQYFSHNRNMETIALFKWFLHYFICAATLFAMLSVLAILGIFLYMFLYAGVDITKLIYRRLKNNVEEVGS